MARPYQGEQTTLEKLQSRNILIAIDTSRSMLCQDVSTDRLTASKSFSLQMLKNFPTDRIGVLAFAGSSNVIAPLTIDHLAVHDTLAQLDTNSLSRQGSNLAEAVSHGVEVLNKTGKRANALVVFSDGEEHDSGVDKAIAEAKKAGVQIITIGVGTTTGGIIPSTESSDGKHRNNQGEVVHTKLHPELLQKLANETNGAYTSIQSSPQQVIKAALEKMESFEQEGREQTVPHERYQWFLAAAVCCALLSSFIRAGWRGQTPALLVTAAFFTLTPNAQAEDSWLEQQRHTLFTKPAAKKNAYKELSNGNFKEAAELFDSAVKYSSGEERAQLSMALGQAHYRDKNYAAAAKAFSDALLTSDVKAQAIAEYNLGNALFKKESEQLGDPGKLSLEEYLLKKAADSAQQEAGGSQQAEKLTDEQLASLEKNFTNALEKYSSSQKTAPSPDSEANIKSTQQVIKTIQTVRKKLKEQEKNDDQQGKDDQQKDNQEQDKGDQKDEEKSKDEGDQKDKSDQASDGEADKKDQSGSEGESDQQDKGDKQDEGEQSDDADPDGEADKEGQDAEAEQSDKGEQPGEEKDDSSQSADENSTPDAENSEGSNDGKASDEQASQPANSQASDNQQPSKHGYNITEQEARDLLEKHADMQKRPLQKRGNPWRNQNPDIDW